MRSERLAFGPFVADTKSFRLFRDGIEVVLRPQAFRAFIVLGRNIGQHVDYKQMVQDGWDGAMVSKHTVAVTIGEIRKALQEYGSWVHYRPRLGFRLEIPKSENHVDRAQIRAVEQRWIKALKTKDIESIMAPYAPDDNLLIINAIPQHPSAGAKAYRRDWEDFLAAFPGPIRARMNGVTLSVEGNLSYAHATIRILAADRSHKTVDLTMRVTDVMRKIDGKWMIVHEHVSFPVDLANGKLSCSSKLNRGRRRAR